MLNKISIVFEMYTKHSVPIGPWFKGLAPLSWYLWKGLGIWKKKIFFKLYQIVPKSWDKWEN